MNAKKLRKLRKKIESAGGLVYIDENLPDDVAEQFFEEVMSCPDCARAMAEAKRSVRPNDH